MPKAYWHLEPLVVLPFLLEMQTVFHLQDLIMPGVQMIIEHGKPTNLDLDQVINLMSSTKQILKLHLILNTDTQLLKD